MIRGSFAVGRGSYALLTVLTRSTQRVKLGAKVSKFNAGLSHWHNNGKVKGIVSTHVDDFLLERNK